MLPGDKLVAPYCKLLKKYTCRGYQVTKNTNLLRISSQFSGEVLVCVYVCVYERMLTKIPAVLAWGMRCRLEYSVSGAFVNKTSSIINTRPYIRVFRLMSMKGESRKNTSRACQMCCHLELGLVLHW